MGYRRLDIPGPPSFSFFVLPLWTFHGFTGALRDIECTWVSFCLSLSHVRLRTPKGTPMERTIRRVLALALTIFCMALSAGATHAQRFTGGMNEETTDNLTDYYPDADGVSWDNRWNWAGKSVPGHGASVIIEEGNTVIISRSLSLSNLTLENAVTFTGNVTATDLKVTISGSFNWNVEPKSKDGTNDTRGSFGNHGLDHLHILPGGQLNVGIDTTEYLGKGEEKSIRNGSYSIVRKVRALEGLLWNGTTR